MPVECLQVWITQTWQIAILATVVAIACRFTATNRPHLAHALWILVLIRCVTPPFWGHSPGVFSQLHARFAPDVFAAALFEPATNRMPPDVPAIAIPAANADTLSAKDRSLQFLEYDGMGSDRVATPLFEVGSFERNDNVSGKKCCDSTCHLNGFRPVVVLQSRHHAGDERRASRKFRDACQRISRCGWTLFRVQPHRLFCRSSCTMREYDY